MTTSSNALDQLSVLLGECVMETKKFGGRGRMTVDRLEGDTFVRLRSSRRLESFRRGRVDLGRRFRHQLQPRLAGDLFRAPS